MRDSSGASGKDGRGNCALLIYGHPQDATAGIIESTETGSIA
ncbi:MAG: hypothetical protein ABSD38_22510 [Syntrophorhabdales bacterium]